MHQRDVAEAVRLAERSDPPDESRLSEILSLFSRRGVVRLGEGNQAERYTPLMVMPGIAILSADGWMDQLRAWSTATGEAALDL